MREEYTTSIIEIEDIYGKILESQRNSYRLVAISATGTKTGAEVIYSLALGYQLENYKLIVPDEKEITSVSDIYPSAALFENEIKELFGVKIKSINLDYDNKFYRIKAKTPFRKVEETKETQVEEEK